MARSRVSGTIGKRSGLETPVSRALHAALTMVMDGTPVAEAAADHGLPVEAVRSAWREYAQGGWSAVQPGVRAGSVARRKLNGDQENAVQQLVRDHLPTDLGMEAPLWDRDAVRVLVSERIGVQLPERTLSAYLERWGFMPEKPLRRVHREHPAPMRAWMRADYPVVALQAREAGAVLMWWGDVPLSRRPHLGAAAKPVGRQRLLFAVSNRGDLRWGVRDEQTDAKAIIAFMDKLALALARPVHVILADDPVFTTPAFIDWSLRNKQRIQFTLLPALLAVPSDRGQAR